MKNGKIKFVLDGGDDHGVMTLVAPEDMTIKQLIEQLKKIDGTYGDRPAIYYAADDDIPDVLLSYNDAMLSSYADTYSDQWRIRFDRLSAKFVAV